MNIFYCYINKKICNIIGNDINELMYLGSKYFVPSHLLKLKARHEYSISVLSLLC